MDYQLINNIKTMSSVLGKIIADFDTSITAKIAVAGTTATLLSILDDDGATIANGRYFITIDGDNSSKEHFSCTLTGTALTVLKSISRKGVESSGAVREHRVGATVTMTNFAHIKFINDLLDGTTDLDGATPLKYDADPTLTDDKHIATKKYADDLAIAGSPNMSTAAKGIAEEATEAEIDADTGAGATAARLAVNPSTLATSKYGVRLPTADQKAALAGSGTPAAGNKYVTADTDALKELLANKDTDGTLAADSDTKYPSQKAVKTYADAKNGDYISAAEDVNGGSFDLAIPAGANKAIIQVFDAKSGNATNGKAELGIQLIVFKTGLTSAYAHSSRKGSSGGGSAIEHISLRVVWGASLTGKLFSVSNASDAEADYTDVSSIKAWFYK